MIWKSGSLEVHIYIYIYFLFAQWRSFATKSSHVFFGGLPTISGIYGACDHGVDFLNQLLGHNCATDATRPKKKSKYVFKRLLLTRIMILSTSPLLRGARPYPSTECHDMAMCH